MGDVALLVKSALTGSVSVRMVARLAVGPAVHRVILASMGAVVPPAKCAVGFAVNPATHALAGYAVLQAWTAVQSAVNQVKPV